MTNRFAEVIFPIQFRQYQQELLNKMQHLHQKGERRFHFLTPPGSGKTILGLEMIRRLGMRAVVFSPNTTIQAQWMRKLSKLTDKISISDDPFTKTDIVSLTYQSISTKDRNTGELHENARQSIAALKDYHTIVLDECHHLTAYWAEVIANLANDNKIVIGLTATPPLDRDQKQINTYLSLIGDIDYQVSLPAIIKDGYLAPFQDLVWITEPTQEELNQLENSSQVYSETFKQLENLSPPLTSLPLWVESRLQEYRNTQNRIVPFPELLLQKPDYCIALVRYLNHYGSDIPASVHLIEEMQETPVIHDIVLVLEDYALNYLSGSQERYDLFNQLQTALEAIGFSLTANGISPANRGIRNILSLSQNKMLAMKQILKHESQIMDTDLRCLILTDYNQSQLKDGTTAPAVMELISSDPDLIACHPVLVTGTSLQVNDSLISDFRIFIESDIKDRNLKIELEYQHHEHYYNIIGKGPDWKTKTYVMLITDMFEQGLCRCIVSNRSMLGQGWDSTKLNTLIDLTTVSSYVAVNQIRGRTLRLDPENSHKTANNWDIVTLIPDGTRGFFDLDRLYKKHEQLWGISDDKVIEKGIGHIHPELTNADIAALAGEQENMNKEMLERAIHRYDTYMNWEVGKPYRNQETLAMEFIPLSEELKITVPNQQKASLIQMKLNQKWVNGYFLLILTLISCGLALFFAVFIALYSKNKFNLALQNHTAEDFIKRCATVVLHTMQELELIESTITEADIHILVRNMGSYRIFLKNSDYGNLFSATVGELFLPIQNQRYLIEKMELDDNSYFWSNFWSFKPKYEVTGYYPVPEILGESRAKANLFEHYWNQYIGPGKTIFARRGEGREHLKQHFRKKPVAIHQKSKWIWY